MQNILTKKQSAKESVPYELTRLLNSSWKCREIITGLFVSIICKNGAPMTYGGIRKLSKTCRALYTTTHGTKTMKRTTHLCLCVCGVWVFPVGAPILGDDEISEATILLPQILGAVMSTGGVTS